MGGPGIEALTVTGINKTFPGVKALVDVETLTDQVIKNALLARL